MTGQNTDEQVFHKYTFFNVDFPFFITREIDRAEQFNESRRFRRDFWKIIYVIDGYGEKIINELRYPIQPGSVFMIHPEDRTTFSMKSDSLELYNILFMPELVAAQLAGIRDDQNFFSILRPNGREGERPQEWFYITEGDAEVKHIVRTLEREYEKMPPNYRVRIPLLLLELLIVLARKGCRNARHLTGESVIDYINSQIERNFAKELRLDMLAERIGIDKSRLCRLYRAGTGRTIMDSLRLRRLAEAARMLPESECSIPEVCYSVGFRDLSYFYRCFLRQYGVTPGDFKNRC